MHIHSALPVAFSHIGQRDINQDTLYPAVDQATDATRLFVVCDGMGGADKGEVASELLCKAIIDYAMAMDYPIFDIVHVRSALDWAYKAYRDYLQQHPFVNRIGSTFAFLQFHEQGVTVAHMGDSRVYQLRAGEILFQTQDHREVNDMVRAGVITAEQARTHPWRNRLSRVVMAYSSGKDDQTSRSNPDVTLLKDVQAGDYFFMCTDGVLEQLDDQTLGALLADDKSDRAKAESIQAFCNGQTKDNYSGYLIGIREVLQTESIRPVETV